MGKVYRNKKEVPIPEFAYVNNYDARVYIIENDSSNKSHQRIIGYATSEKTMAPNQTFRNLNLIDVQGVFDAHNPAPVLCGSAAGAKRDGDGLLLIFCDNRKKTAL